MATQEDIDRINALIERGIEESRVGNVEVKYDLDALMKQRDKLERELRQSNKRSPSRRRGTFRADYDV